MDVVVPSICLSSVAGALLFYAGGRLSQRPVIPPPRPLPEEVLAERTARQGAESEAAGAWRSHREAVTALAEERSRSTALRDELSAERDARTRADAEAARDRHRLVDEAAALRDEAVRLRQQVASLGDRLTTLGELCQARATHGGQEAARAAAAERRVAELGEALDRARAEIERAAAASRRTAGESATVRAQMAAQAAAHAREAALLAAARAEADAAQATAAQLRRDNEDLARELSALERDHAAGPALAEVQRRGVEAAVQLQALGQRAEELARREEENADLRRRLAALAGAAVEAEALRRQVRDLTAQGFSRRVHESLERGAADAIPSVDSAWDDVTVSKPQPLEESLTRGLHELCQREEGCRAAVLADGRGLLLAAYGEGSPRDEMAAAASLTTYAADRLRELIPLGQPASFALVDDNAVVFRARWLRWEDECFLLGTLGAAPPADGAPAEALRARLAELLR